MAKKRELTKAWQRAFGVSAEEARLAVAGLGEPDPDEDPAIVSAMRLGLSQKEASAFVEIGRARRAEELKR